MIDFELCTEDLRRVYSMIEKEEALRKIAFGEEQIQQINAQIRNSTK